MISKSVMDNLIAKGRIDENDVLVLRREMFGDDHKISSEEAEALFSINDACEGNADWSSFFIEAIVDHLIHNTKPKGYLSADQAKWVIEHTSHSGIAKSATEIEMLIKVMEVAEFVPDELEMFAMQQVKQAVLTGEGKTRSGEELVSGQITLTEVELLRRILYACGGRDSAAVSRCEAEMLFDINDAIEDVSKDPAWADLFVKAVANYLMATRGFQSPSREEALRREEWLDDTSIDIVGFFGKILAGGLRAILDGYRDESDNSIQEKEADIAISEVVTEGEAGWLVERINNNDVIDGAEKALLMFIDKEASTVCPSLKPLIEKVA